MTIKVEVAGLAAGERRSSCGPKPVTSTRGRDSTADEGRLTSRTAPRTFELMLDVPEPRLWTPESPNLYDVTLELRGIPPRSTDEVQTYFGLRTIARGRFGDEPFERILLNGKPLYLRAALDQSFNPKGIYTAPDDDFFKRDMVIAKAMGLNGLRIHIKPDEPRRLYWADRLGVLILEDMPNTWQQNAEGAHRPGSRRCARPSPATATTPSIIAWVAFNETWGLGKPEDYKKDRDTQAWVGEMVDAIRKLDPTRLVEDNSPCNYDHIANTDLNSWHFYIDDHRKAREHIEHVVDQTKPGSGFNYCPGHAAIDPPLINSEYGAVSAGGGDRDISWGLRDLTTQLRRQRKIQGFVYTELTDIEWEHNGLVNYDRTPKLFGYDTWLPDMRPNELLGADFIGYDAPPAIVGKPGETVTVPIFVSHFSDRTFQPKLRWWVSGYDARADIISGGRAEERPDHLAALRRRRAGAAQGHAAPIPVRRCPGPDLARPGEPAVRGQFRQPGRQARAPVAADRAARAERRHLRFAPGDFARQKWTESAKAPAGKVYGHGKGFFEYRIQLPAAVAKAHPESIYYLFEASAKATRERVDWPERVNRQDYPQTDAARQWTSTLAVSFNERLDRDPRPCPTTRPTAAACSRTWPASSTGATASWSTA